MDTADIFGYLGAVLLSITLLPQIYLTYKTQKAEDISFYFLFLQVITCIFFLTYGILGDAQPIVVANIMVLLELLVLLFFKSIYAKKNDSNIQISSI